MGGAAAYLGAGKGTPARKPRGEGLTNRQKRGSLRRVVAERGVGTMKVWRAAAYRNPRRRHTLMFKYVAGLHNRMSAE